MTDDYFEGEYILHVESEPSDRYVHLLPERKNADGHEYIRDPITGIYFCVFFGDDEENEEENRQFGRFGGIRLAFLKEYYPEMYRFLHATGTLVPHLMEINRISEKHLNTVMERMKAERCITESLKEEKPVDYMIAVNSVFDEAEKAVLTDVVYNERFMQVGLEELYGRGRNG